MDPDVNQTLLVWGHIWAFFPMNLVGLLLRPGARWVRVVGTAHMLVAGPILQRFFRTGYRAITFGGFIYCKDEETARDPVTEAHEKRHVLQQMVLGPLFPFLYYGAMLGLLVLRRDPYLRNPFELDAMRAAGEVPPR